MIYPARLPESANVIIIGAGVVGCALAYQLARRGVTDILVLDKGVPASGTTWHAAGAVAQYRSNANLMRLIGRSIELYATLEAETGQATGWKRTGGMRLASTPERRAEYERTITTARSFGLAMELIGPAEIKRLFPLIETRGVDCALYIPSDGVIGPSDVTAALAKGARLRGATILERTAVTGFAVENGAIAAVETDQGPVACEQVALAAGLWSRALGRAAGVNVPLWACQHCYLTTAPIEGLAPDLPVMRDPDRWHYFREWSGGLMVGQYEPDPLPSPRAPSAADPEFHLEPEHRDRFFSRFEGLLERLPVLETVGVRQWFNGLESFTEDQNPILGEAPELRNFFVCAGFNAYGVSAAGGFADALADWMIEGAPPFDLGSVDIRRFQRYHGSDRQVRARTLEGQGHHYTIHWPFEEVTAARPLRRSPFHDRLAARGACFGAKAGWERPNWFAPAGTEARERPSFSRPDWFAAVAGECRAARERAALFDLSSFSKFELVGADAERVLQYLCAGDVGRAPGRIVYTPMLNPKGGFESDVTVCRLAEDRYYLVTGAAAGPRDLDHIRRHLPSDARLVVHDVTSAYAVLALMGPKARAILAACAEGDVSNEAFPFGRVRELMVAGAPVRALRISYVGELGWELHVPADYALALDDALRDAGAEPGLTDAGYRALDSLRLEKGHRAFGADIGPDDTPFEAGLGFTVAFSKPADFIGRAALEAVHGQPPARRLVTLALEEGAEALLLGGETIYRDGQRVGALTSGGYGHTVGLALGLGYVRCPEGAGDDFLDSGQWQVEAAMRRWPARVHRRPLHDPEGARVRAS